MAASASVDPLASASHQPHSPAPTPATARATSAAAHHRRGLANGHLMVASMMAPDAAAVAVALRDLGKGLEPAAADADLAAEVRLDGMWAGTPTTEQATSDLESITGAANGTPLMATLRPRRHGGRFDGDEAVRLNLLAAAARCGFEAIDVEAGSAHPAVIDAMHAGGARVVVSEHWEGPAPSREDGLLALLRQMDAGGESEKLAFDGGSFADTLRALELCRAHAERGGEPAVMPMGAGAAPVRALLALVGNHATYGHAPGLPPAASGQPALADIVATWRHWGLAGDDLAGPGRAPRNLLLVVGHPVAHSLSPRLMNAALRSASRAERYAALDVPASTSALRLAAMVAPRAGVVGLSVTAPHKQDALRIAQGDAVAKEVGAANCLRWRGGAWEATNTDATALLRLLSGHLDAGAPCVILGSGGAARAAAWAGRQLGASVHFTSRDPARAQAFAKATGATWTPWEARTRLSGQAWVQAAALPAGEPSPVSRSQLRGKPLVVEMLYTPDGRPTKFEQEAAAAGSHVVGGRTVLLEQAIDAYRHWFDSAPHTVAEGAMRQALAGSAGGLEAARPGGAS